MAAPTKRVNLAIREGFEYSTLGKILAWSLSTGRVIVILTELVVILAFLSRFWLDRQLTDLNEQNTSKKRQIEAAAKFEGEFRQAQKRLAAYQKFISSGPGAADIVREAASLLPAGVTLTRIFLAEQDLTFSGDALSEEGLAGFIHALSSSGHLKDIKLTSVSLATEGGQRLVFSVVGSLPTKTKDKQATEEIPEELKKK